MANKVDIAEVGNTGLNRYGAHIMEEFLPALRWPKAGKVYEEMSTNDPTIGAILFAAEQLIRRVDWNVEPGGDTSQDKEAADFLLECMHDMSMSWPDLISEILSMLPFGWSYHEIVYKYRKGSTGNSTTNSKYNDGRIGWRKIPIRSQLSMDSWEFDEQGGIMGMHQQLQTGGKVFIPIEKALLFRAKIIRNNPEGRSVLRNAYRPWFFKKRIEEIEGIGIERDLAGLPVLIPPDGLDIWNPEDPEATRLRNMAIGLVTNIRRDQNEGVVLPFGWELKLLSTGSRRQFDTNAILNRYDQRIAITVLADMVLLGADKVGSFALAEVKKSLFGGALEAWADAIAEVFNRHAVRRLIDLNGFSNLTDYPKLVHGKIEGPTISELGSFIKEITGAGFDITEEDVDNYLRKVAGLPSRTPDSTIYEQKVKGAMPVNPIDPNNPNPKKQQDEEDEDEDIVPPKEGGSEDE